MRDSQRDWWADAFDLSLRAERLRRHFFRVTLAGPAHGWEPPADVLEGHGRLAITVALPGVAAEAVELKLESSALHIRAHRVPALTPQVRHVHRLEIPYGRFERQIALPPGRWALAAHELLLGCLYITLNRSGEHA